MVLGGFRLFHVLVTTHKAAMLGVNTIEFFLEEFT